MLVILLMETLALSMQLTNSDPCNHIPALSENYEFGSTCENEEIDQLNRQISNISAGTSTLKEMKETFSENIKHLENISKSDGLDSCGIFKLTTVMGRLIDLRKNFSESESDCESESVLELALNATSNLLSHAHNEAWMELSPCDRSKTATRLLVGMEKISEILAEVTAHTGSIIKTAPEIGLQINVINVIRTKSLKSSITIDTSDLHLEISFENVKRQASKNGLVRTAFIQYKNIEKWLKSNVTSENKSYVGPSIITKVFSISILPRKERRIKLNKSIRFTMLHKVLPQNSSNVSCVFWNFSADFSVGHWSDDGCRVVSFNDYNTTCECDHLTHFAVLMSSVNKTLPPEDKFALEIITYIGCAISIVCLALSLFTFCFFRNLQCDRNTIHKNLAFSLLIAQLIFVFGINQYDKKTLCAVIAGFLHYFFLASFAWMCLEGVQLYILLVEVFEIEKSRVKWYYLGGYGTPALIVLTSVSVMAFSSNGASGVYGTKEHCWLSIEAGFIWAFNGPVIAVLAVNLVMFGLTISIMCKHASTASWKLKNKSKIHEIGLWLRGAAIIMVLLGTPWIVGIFMTFDRKSVAFEYIFAILNSLQGLFIFVFHCLTNDKVQKEYQRAIQRSTFLPECIRSKHGDMSGGGVLSTPNQSRSSERTTVQLYSSPQKDEIISQRRLCTASGSPRLADSLGNGSVDDSCKMESPEDSNGVLESAITSVNDNTFNM